ncbi:hypothetical protein [Sneathiella litorea]|uniref:Uncharacterized protein n=1 Tax=Sneathiella litorea TaxID=2606216 RepID=A0A6L8W592_9PROT|nr:hypothetical protein [Sneathiella litorea]MZR29387.1 hypothetical protein [Sneathiella litorea]
MSIETSALAAYRNRARNTNVNDVTLLATDYLNHFNEALMLAELVVDVPEVLDDFINWSPISYAEHFRKSNIADRELAMEAYHYSPSEYKEPLENITLLLDQEIQALQGNLSSIHEMDRGKTKAEADNQCLVIRKLIDHARSIINGQSSGSKSHSRSGEEIVYEKLLDQEKINEMFD